MRDYRGRAREVHVDFAVRIVLLGLLLPLFFRVRKVSFSLASFGGFTPSGFTPSGFSGCCRSCTCWGGLQVQATGALVRRFRLRQLGMRMCVHGTCVSKLCKYNQIIITQTQRQPRTSSRALVGAGTERF